MLGHGYFDWEFSLVRSRDRRVSELERGRQFLRPLQVLRDIRNKKGLNSMKNSSFCSSGWQDYSYTRACRTSLRESRYARFRTASQVLTCILNMKKREANASLNLSGWQDSNLRPPGPKPGTLTGLCYTPNSSVSKTERKCRNSIFKFQY